MEYIVYTAHSSYAVAKDAFDAKNFIGANVFDPSTNEMFIVIDGALVKLGEAIPPVVEEPEVILPEDPPAEEEVPSEEEITE